MRGAFAMVKETLAQDTAYRPIPPNVGAFLKWNDSRCPVSPAPRYCHHVADPLSSSAFYESARDFAQRALQAHHAREFRRVALEAGTALEHLAKACLSRRSPALLVELRRGEGNFGSLLRLLEIPGGARLPEVRTVSLRDALDRVQRFVKSDVPAKDLAALVDMRDGTVHAALSDEVEELLLVAFVRHADALVADLGEHRDNFWATYRPLVDALLKDASDKVAHHVEVMIEAARASFNRRYGDEPHEVLEVVRRVAELQTVEYNELESACPACESEGVKIGYYHIEWDDEDEGQVPRLGGRVWFVPEAFVCRVCGLRLDSRPELVAAGKGDWLEMEGADPYDYEPPLDEGSFEDSFYETWRESREERPPDNDG